MKCWGHYAKWKKSEEDILSDLTTHGIQKIHLTETEQVGACGGGGLGVGETVRAVNGVKFQLWDKYFLEM